MIEAFADHLGIVHPDGSALFHACGTCGDYCMFWNWGDPDEMFLASDGEWYSYTEEQCRAYLLDRVDKLITKIAQPMLFDEVR